MERLRPEKNISIQLLGSEVLLRDRQGLKDVVVPNNLNMELQIGTLMLRLDGDDGEAWSKNHQF